MEMGPMKELHITPANRSELVIKELKGSTLEGKR
jgi:hypothetical protein